MKQSLPIILFLFIGVLLGNTTLKAQKYNWTLGLRMGTEIGMTTVVRVAKKSSLEGTVQYSNLYHATRLGVNYREHLGFLGRRFNLYIGGGAGASWYHSQDVNVEDVTKPHMNGIFGLEGVIGKLHVSWDFKPVYSFGGPRVFYSETALSLRYVIFKKKWRPFKKFKKKEPFWERVF
jgi:hypothetical protein